MTPAPLGLSPPHAVKVSRSRVELELLAIQCAIALLYTLGVLTGVLHASPHYVGPALTWIVAYHLFRVIYVLRFPVKQAVEAATPFLDIFSISAGWLVLHQAGSPIWAVYLIALVGYARRRGGGYFGLISLFVIANLVVTRSAIAATDGLPILDADIVTIAALSGIMALIAGAVSRGWQEAEARARELAETDPLTGVANRRAFRRRLEAYDMDPDGPFAILMLDIDNLKQLNDRYGHVLGDDVLEHVASIISANLREVDTIARYGGDEFVVSMPGASCEDAEAIAERLRTVIEQESRATVSIGCAARVNREDVDRVLNRADALLLAAKREGKNRTESSTLPRSA
jgi:diguanylate cyclase (GGDEF)-like protein